MQATATATSNRIEIAYQPQPKQMRFHECKADEVLYGGAAGGGKSEALFQDANNLCMYYPGVAIPIFRRTFTELEATHIRKARALSPKLGSYNESRHEFRYVNGSILEFRYCANERDVYAYQSAEWDALYIDELTHFTEFQYKYLRSRVRTTKPGLKTKVKSSTNPGNIGHQWVRKRFIDPAKPFQVWSDNDGKTSRCFIPATLYDNPILMASDPEYIESLRDLPEDERRALLDGDWDVFAGQVFKEWRRDLHVIEPFAIPDSWPRFRSVDYGREAPFSCGWWAVDNDGHVYRYRELYKAGLTAPEQAVNMNALSAGESIQATWSDPSMFAKDSDGQSIADRYTANGVALIPARNDRISGKQLLHEYLKPYTNLDGKLDSKLKVFSTCTDFIRTVPALIFAKTNVEDVDTRGEDHAYDETRYFLNMFCEPLDGNPFSSDGKGEYDKTIAGNMAEVIF